VENQDVYMANSYKRYFTNETKYELGLKLGKDTKINVVATLKEGEQRDQFTLYNEILVNIERDESASVSRTGSVMYVLLFLVVGGGAGYIIIVFRDKLFRPKEP